MMVRVGRTRKPGMAAFYNTTAENPNPLAVAGRVVAGQRGAGQRGAGQRGAGQRRASPQEEDERIAAYEEHFLEGLLQSVCVSQQSSCSSSHAAAHAPPFSPLASPPFTALASRESAQSTPPASPGKTHASGDYDTTGSRARGLRRGCWCAPCGGGPGSHLVSRWRWRAAWRVDAASRCARSS